MPSFGLIIISIEILGNAIRISNEIKGGIEPGKTVELAQYSDGPTVIKKNSQSVLNLFIFLSQGEKYSWLRKNESKSELLWLGSTFFVRITF